MRDRSDYLALLADSYGKAESVVEGLKAIAEGLARAEQSGEAYYTAELYRIKGELLLQQAIPVDQESEDCFQRAIEIARSQQTKSLELRAVMSLSRFWQRQGKQDEARNLLGEIYGWFTEGFDTADLRQAQVLLEELS